MAAPVFPPISVSNHIPGYGGFCPSVKHNYGNTYGKATESYYLTSRRDCLSTSKRLPLRRTASDSGISFAKSSSRPNSAQNNPWSKPLPYSLHHTGARRTEILSFNKTAQEHREQYKDHTGHLPEIKSFTHRRLASAPPISRTDRLTRAESNKPPSSIFTPSYSSKTPSTTVAPKYQRKPSARDKALRDIHFEAR